MDRQPVGPQPTTTSRPRLSWRKKLAFSGIAALLGLLLLEGVGRIAGLPKGSLRHLRHLSAMSETEFRETIGMFPPGFRGRIEWPPVLAFDVAINSLGFRGPEPRPSDDPQHGATILCLGDSTTFGLYVDDDETYPHLLQAALPQHQIHNAGHPAWGLHDELRFFRERGHRTDPEIVLHVVCINDFSDIQGDLKAERGRYAQKLARIAKGSSVGQWFEQSTALGALATQASILLRKLRKGEAESIEVGELHPISPVAWQEFAQLYAELATDCKTRDLRLITACLPCIEASPGRSKELFEDRVADLAHANHVEFVRVDAAFRQAETDGEMLFLLPHDTHANAAGNRILAAKFAELLSAESR